MTNQTSPRSLDFKLIERPLDTLIIALGNKIEREWPTQFSAVVGARELFLITVRVANATYRTVRWICADKPRDPLRRLEYSISVPPLNRTILDSIFMTVFVLEDIGVRCEWYYKAGLREEQLELQRYKDEYGSLPEWQEWLTKLKPTVNLESGSRVLHWGLVSTLIRSRTGPILVGW